MHNIIYDIIQADCKCKQMTTHIIAAAIFVRVARCSAFPLLRLLRVCTHQWLLRFADLYHPGDTERGREEQLLHMLPGDTCLQQQHLLMSRYAVRSLIAVAAFATAHEAHHHRHPSMLYTVHLQPEQSWRVKWQCCLPVSSQMPQSSAIHWVTSSHLSLNAPTDSET